MEEDPRQIRIFDIGKYLEVLEDQVAKGRVGKSMNVDRSDKNVVSRDNLLPAERYVSTIVLKGTQFLCAPSEYPAPWPLKPFSAPLARVQRKYSHSALPRKLIVHDPWNCLLTDSDEAKRVKRDQCKWGTKEDNIRTYRLELRASSEESSDSDSDSNSDHDSKGEKEDPRNGSKYDAKKNSLNCPVAHLYISPRRKFGRGNHSFVYQAELELPREMLVRPKACWECMMKQYRETKLLYQAGVIDDKNKDIFLKADENKVKEFYFRISEMGLEYAEEIHDEKLEALKNSIDWQTKPPYCSHLSRDVPIPPSHRVSVTAKLCLPRRDEDDDDHEYHLANEGKLYQKFPGHMFEHWNGYNLIPPVRYPTPVGAVVPQFYGYYLPDEENEPMKEGEYMSPILLLEHCGVQVDPKKLSLDDRYAPDYYSEHI